VDFEAFGIPDGLKITNGGSVLVNSYGLVSGLSKYTFNANSFRNLRVIVTGNQNIETGWDLRISCPGQPLSTPIAQRSVSLRMDGISTCLGYYSISFNGGPYTTGAVMLSVGRGHNAKLQFNGSCLPYSTLGRPYIDTGYGVKYLIGNDNFDVAP
jgi:hypothetical protein